MIPFERAAPALLLAASLLAAAPAWADWSEQSYYDPTTRRLVIQGILPQPDSLGTELIGGVLLYKGGRAFELLGDFNYPEIGSRVTQVRVVNTAPPVFLVTAELNEGCYKLDPGIAPEISGNTIGIKIKAHAFTRFDEFRIGGCSPKIVVLPFEMNRTQHRLRPGTYTVVAHGTEGSVSASFYYPGVNAAAR